MLLILGGAHLALGPLLTLIAFKSGKPSLKFDLSCIVLLQLGALLYGGMIIDQQRPAFVVFGVDRFTTIPAAEVDFDRIQYPELKRSAGIGPRLAQIRPPDDPQQRRELLFAVLLEGQKDLEYRAEFYEPYRPDLAHLRARSIDLAKIAARDATAQAAIAAFAEQHDGRLEDYISTCRCGAKTRTSCWRCRQPTECRRVGFRSARGWRIIEKRVQVVSFASAPWSRMCDDR